MQQDGSRICERCGAQQPAHMRFCTECGHSADVQPAAAPPAAASSPSSDSPDRVAARMSAAIGAPLCSKCRGVGDPGTSFCKFCGARYSDGGGPTSVDSKETLGASPPQPTGTPLARVVSVLKDGSDGEVFEIHGDSTDFGRVEGDVVLADDPYLSDRHARICREGDTFVLRDLDSVNGVYMRLRGPVDLQDGDMLLIGQQVLRFEALRDVEAPLGPAATRGAMVFGTPEVPRFARLVQYTTEGVGRDVLYLYRDETVLGRENGDIVFTDDPFLSRRHAAIRVDRNTQKFVFEDLGSSNGSAIRMRGERRLDDDDQFRVGRHLFRFERSAGAPGGQTSR